MKTYRIENELNLTEEANKIVKANANSRKYNYSFEEVMNWLETLPTKGDAVELQNAQSTGYFSDLFAFWGTHTVGYTYCLGFCKNPQDGTVRISISTQQTVGRKFYGISPKVAA